MFISTLSSSLQWVATWPKRLHVKHPTGIEMSWKWRKTVGSDAEAPSVSIHVIRTRIVVACDFMDDAQEALLQTKNVRSHCCNVCLKPCVLFLNQQGFKNLQAPLFLSLQVTSGKSAQWFGLAANARSGLTSSMEFGAPLHTIPYIALLLPQCTIRCTTKSLWTTCRLLTTNQVWSFWVFWNQHSFSFNTALRLHDAQWRSKAKCRPRPAIKLRPFQQLKFACKSLKWKKTLFRTYLKI